MACSINHGVFGRKYPHITTCPDCHCPLQNDKVVDLTNAPSSPPGPDMAPATRNPPPPARANRGLIAPLAAAREQTIFQRFDTTHRTAKAKVAESVAATADTTKNPIEQVAVAVYVAEEHTTMVGELPVARIEKLQKVMTLTPQVVASDAPFPCLADLFEYVKDKWSVPAPYKSDPLGRIVGPITLGNGASMMELSWRSDCPIRLGDVKLPMASITTKNQSVVNIFFPQVVKGDRKEAQKRTTGKRTRTSSLGDGQGRSRSKVKFEAASGVDSIVKTEVKPEVKTEFQVPFELEDGLFQNEELRDAPVETKPNPVRKRKSYGDLGPPLQTRGAARRISAQSNEAEPTVPEASDDDDDDGSKLFPSVEEL
ncbi:hypothetical protein F4861DRAFT_544571, partial [Xylaria intraflava]